MLEPGLELLLFRLGDRGYASPRDRVREVVDVGAGQPAVPGLSASSLGGLGGGQRPVALVSLRVALGLPDRGPEGRILVAATRTGPVGFLVDEVVRVLRYDPASCPPETTRLSGYVTASFQALGGSWLLIDWDAIRLPAGITAPRWPPPRLRWGVVIPPRSAVPSDPTSREFRDSVGMFTTGITVVTAVSERFGHGMTANAFASVSLEPLLVLVCVVKDALMHKVLDETGRFAVSVLAADQEDLARYFSDSGRPAGMAQFHPVAWHPGPVSGAPLLDGALAYLECDVHSAHDGGDHTVFLGRARWVERAKPGGEPLLYFGGNYRRLENPPEPL